MNQNILNFTNEFINKFHLKEINIESSKDQYLLALIKAGSNMASLTHLTSFMSESFERWFGLLNIQSFPINRLIESKNLNDLDLTWLSYFYNDEQTPFIPELLFYSSLAIMLNDPSLSHEQINIGLEYLKKIGNSLKLEREFTLNIRGWLTNKAASDINQIIEQIFENINESSLHDDDTIDFLFKNIQSAKKLTETTKKIDEKEWTKIKLNLAKELDRLADNLGTFNLDLYQVSEFKQVKEFIEQSLFRITVLGEFKRGKSTIINSLLELLNLVPSATLPCTSGLIEIKYGKKENYYLNEDGPLGKYNEISRYDFIHNSGNAHSNIELRERSEKEFEAEKINRWKVECDSEFLKDYQIQLIDTPGLNESPLRDLISLEEAQKTDAAIFVLNASQQGTMTELNFIEKVKPLSKNMIFVINRGDEISENSRDEVFYHTYSRVHKILPDIAKENFVLISAKAIEEYLNNRTFKDQDFWLEQFNKFKKILNNHLLKNSAPKRLEKITKMVNTLDKNLGKTLNNLLDQKKTALSQFIELDSKFGEKKEQKEELQNDIKTASDIIKNSWPDCASPLVKSVNNEVIPYALKKLESDQYNWTSEYNPVFSGKKFITDVSNQAKERVQIFIKESLEKIAEPIISKQIELALNMASNKIENKLKDYLTDTNIDPKDILEDVKKQTIQTFADISGMNVDPNSSIFFGTALTTIISGIVGYIVADIILYYVLGVISGFLNPYLLASAVVLMIVGILWKGKGVVGSFIKSKVYNKFFEKLSSNETHNQIEKGVKENVLKIFQKISESFSKSANNVINEVDYHRENIKKEIEELVNKYGTNKQELENIIIKMESDKKDALSMLNSITNDINKITSDESALLIQGN